MSIYSGKCDVADFFEGESDGYLQRSEIYLGENPVPLRINNQHDLSPYYPHLVIMAGGMKNKATCHISERSFVDVEEEEHLGWILHDFQRYKRRCKRKKVDYLEEEAIKALCWHAPTEVDREIAHRVALYGDKATIDGIRDPLHEYYRERLLERMVELGWDQGKAAYWIWKDWTLLWGDEEK